jgi:hypothetical protein
MVSKVQEELLKKLISFDSLSTEHAESLKLKLYQYFFKWDPKAFEEGSKN